jgi:hypothetical protein
MAFTVVQVDPKANAKAEVVSAAKDVLAMAERGEIIDLSWSASCIDGTVKTGFTSTEDGLRRIASVYRLAHRLQLCMDEQASSA